MRLHLSPLQADVLTKVAGAQAPLSTTEVRNQLNAHPNRAVPVVAEQVYRALCRLQRHAMVRRAQASHTRNVHWQKVLEQQEAG